MRKTVLVTMAALALAACGARERTVVAGELDGVRGFLSKAFTSDAAPIEGGGLCGDPALVGDVIGAVDGNGACGIEDAISLQAVSGVSLSTPATINCKTAQALKTWIEVGARPAIGKRGGGLSELKVAASYACRTRNHQRGARLSEHAKGNAIDISAIRMSDGSEITLLDGWNKGKDGKALKAMHQAACGPFGTVLGPNSDAHHRDHFHFDVASYRSGSYCR